MFSWPTFRTATHSLVIVSVAEAREKRRCPAPCRNADRFSPLVTGREYDAGNPRSKEFRANADSLPGRSAEIGSWSNFARRFRVRSLCLSHRPYNLPMQETERVKLIGGPYRTPRFKFGAVVCCEIRGNVEFVGLTDARIPWPKCRTGKRSRAIILYGALVDAVRRESALAVQYWWGISEDTVWRWRQALGVDRVNAGTSALLSRQAPETCQSANANERRMPTLKSPERAAKIAAARTGKLRPPHVIEQRARRIWGASCPRTNGGS